jgi:hypothetical protein
VCRKLNSVPFHWICLYYGWFSHKHKQSRTGRAEVNEKNSCPNEGPHDQLPQTPGPLYEEVPKSTPEHQDLVELKENVAYGPIMK